MVWRNTFFITIAISAMVSTTSWAASSYSIPVSTMTPITEFGITRNVTNNSCGYAIFIPTNTQTEWNTFITHVPACVTSVDPDPCNGTPGAACTDGSVYVGTYGGYNLRTTPGNCTDSPTPTCDNSTDSLSKIWASTLVVTGITDWDDGQANTTAIVALYPSDDSAAKYCDNLVYAGKSDWFLPSKGQLLVLHGNAGSFTGYNSGLHYVSSTENSSTNAGTTLSSRGKNVVGTTRFRCFRRS